MPGVPRFRKKQNVVCRGDLLRFTIEEPLAALWYL
jgi:hypothetical protein